jgi:hypothetical protein
MEHAREKLISVRHYCFARGVAGRKPESDFRMAFRDLNRLYVEVKRQSERSKPPVLRRKAA